MLGAALLATLEEYLNMHSSLYSECRPYRTIDLKEWKRIRNMSSRALLCLESFSEDDGVVIVNESNIEAVSFCVETIQTCTYGRTSLHRSYLMWNVYRFLSFFEWQGEAPKMESYESWGPFIFELSPKQLSYYLWWRQEANCGFFHESTDAYVWLFVYEKLLNVNPYESNSATLTILESTYSYYRENYPKPSHKCLTVEKFGHLIVNYALFNGLYDKVKELGNRYGVDDDYLLYLQFSKGKYAGLGRYLLNFASSEIKTKSFKGSDEEAYVIKNIPVILEEIYKKNNTLRSLLINDICGKLDQHSCWEFYETWIFSLSTAPLIAHGDHTSFLLNGNTYALATGKTLSSDKELANNNCSWYLNDRGDRFHVEGLYYRKRFSGITSEGRQLIDYLSREIQVIYRAEHGLRTLKRKSCPYTEYTDEINDCIKQCFAANRCSDDKNRKEKDLHTVFSFALLTQEEVSVPGEFKYVRNAQYHPKVAFSGYNDTSVEVLEIADEVEEIAPMAFAGCTNLKAFIGGFGLKKIGVGAFLDCDNLCTAVLQDGTECIEEGAFLGCINLKEVLIPTSVHMIGKFRGGCVFEESVMILCEKYTAAYYYAVEHNLKYRISETGW